MKASRILAGLSAVSIAASMLSMVAASADETEKLTVDEGVATDNFGFDDDADFAETDNVVDVDNDGTTGVSDADKKGGKSYGSKFSNYFWYNSYIPTAKTGFAGWPGWGLSEFPDGWAWALGIKSVKDLTWETFGTKDLDKAVPGYLVLEFDNGKKWLVPAAVDENGTFVTDEVSIPYTGVNKIYFLYEVSEAPYFKLELDKFTVNGKDVELNKDNWKDDVKYVKTTNPSTGADEFFLLDGTNNGTDLVTIVDENDNVVAVEDAAVYYQATIYSKDNQADSVINHALVLWGTKVTATFKVDGIGKIPVHGGVFNGDGDNKGFPHTHVDPKEAKGNGVQKQNLDVKPVNPMFYPSDRCSKDLYDQLVEVYNSDPDHAADAEIRFKTVADKGGVLVANFINIWESDKDRDGTQRHWLPSFRQGFAVYVRKGSDTKVKVQGEKEVSDPVTYFKATPVTKIDGSIQWKDEANGVPYFKMNPDNENEYLLEKVVVALDSDISEWIVNTNLTTDGSHIRERKDKDGNVIGYVSTSTPKKETIKKKSHKELEEASDKEVWVFDTHISMYVPVDADYYLTAQEKADAENAKPGSKGDAVAADFFTGIYSDAQLYVKNEDGTYSKADKDTEGQKYIFIDDVFGLPVDENENVVLPKPNGGVYDPGKKWIPDEKVEDAYCWHPYFLTENGLVDVVTKDYLGNGRTNTPDYTALTDAQIKYLQDNNGMYYNDNIHNAAYGHFVVFGDNTEREYSYRINAAAVKTILDSVQRSVVQRNGFLQRHGSIDIVPWVNGSDTVVYNAYNKLIAPDDQRGEGFTKDYESMYYLDNGQLRVGLKDAEGNKDQAALQAYYYEHARATHGAVWLQCCEGTYLRDVRVHAYTNLLLENDVPKALYNKDNYEALYPTKPVESAASTAAAQPTAGEAAADENAGSGAAAGFGIAGLLLAGAAMVCAKKKER